MPEDQKRTFLMVKSFALIAFSLAAIAYTYQYGRSVNQMNYRSFSVTGEGIVTTVPDIARFSASVITDGGLNVSEVQQQNTQKMNRVIEFAKNQGISEKDIKTRQYTLNPRYEYPSCVAGKTCPAPKISGYTVMQAVTIKIRDMEKSGTLLSGVVENGANSVSDISFVADDEMKARNEARETAIEQGRKQAVSIARSAGFGLGKLISIYEDTGSSETTPVAYGLGDADIAKQSTPAPFLEPGSDDQKVKMVLTYEIR
ncbi:MAG: SIMPL domain-containing protein [Candidatus Moranbacteria bacterium]|nr:SIMPL domain-containing protein [Candidatus Moranbacteria bacterium]